MHPPCLPRPSIGEGVKKIDQLPGFDQQRTTSKTREKSKNRKSSKSYVRSFRNSKLWIYKFRVSPAALFRLVSPARLDYGLVLWSFDDVVFKPGTALGKQPIGEHFSRPFDRQIRCEDPHIGGGPYWTMAFRQLGIKQIGPYRHIHAVPTLRVEVNDRAGTDERIQVTPDCCSFIRQSMEPHSVLGIEHGIGCIDRCIDHIGRQRQLWTLCHKTFKESPTMSILQRIGQSRVRDTDQLEKKKSGTFDRWVKPGGN